MRSNLEGSGDVCVVAVHMAISCSLNFLIPATIRQNRKMSCVSRSLCY